MNTITFAIDTDSHANFMNDLCAYVTGKVDSEKRGEAWADKARSNLMVWAKDWINEHIIRLRTRSGVLSPCSIIITPEHFHDGLGTYYCERDFDEKRAIENYNMKVYCFIEGTLHSRHDKAEFIKKHPPIKLVKRWPAYLSVGIHFNAVATTRVTEVMKQRAKNFFDLSKLPVKVTGFRMLRSNSIDEVNNDRGAENSPYNVT